MSGERTDAKVNQAIENLMELRHDAVAEGMVTAARWLDDAVSELRKARFCERELFARVQELQPERKAQTNNGDGPCIECGTERNLVWFTDDVLWNNVVRRKDNGHDGYATQRWGANGDAILCLPCFVEVVEERGYRPASWRVFPVWPIRREPARRIGGMS